METKTIDTTKQIKKIWNKIYSYFALGGYVDIRTLQQLNKKGIGVYY